MTYSHHATAGVDRAPLAFKRLAFLFLFALWGHALLAATSTWTGAASTDWFNAGNWSAGVPTTTTEVIIAPAGNQPTVGMAGAVANTVTVNAGATLTVSASGAIDIHNLNDLVHTLTNFGTIENNGTISTFRTGSNLTSGSATTVSDNGIFNNNAGATFNIAGSANGVLTSFYEQGSASATFTNAGTILVGQTGTQNARPFSPIAGTFHNLVTGKIVAGHILFSGLLVVDNGKLVNEGSIVLTFLGASSTFGVSTTTAGLIENNGCNALISTTGGLGRFNGNIDNNGGRIIERSSGNSNIRNNSGIIQNLNGGTFSITGTNTGTLTTAIGNIWVGCTSADWFTATNWIDNTVPTAAIAVTILPTANQPVIGAPGAVASSITINSGATLTVTANGAVATAGITNNGTLDIQACGQATLTGAMQNAGTLTNNGLFLVNTASAHTNTGTFTNNGVLEYAQSNNLIPGVINNEIIAKPISIFCSTVPNVLMLGSPVDYPPSAIWYLDAALTMQAGLYSLSTNTLAPTNIPTGVATPVYFRVNSPCGAQVASLSVTLTGSTPDQPMPPCLQAFCAGDNPTVGSLSPSGADYFWYTTPTGGTALPTGTSLVNMQDYYVAYMPAGSCESPRTHVLAIVTTPASGHVCLGGCSN